MKWASVVAAWILSVLAALPTEAAPKPPKQICFNLTGLGHQLVLSTGNAGGALPTALGKVRFQSVDGFVLPAGEPPVPFTGTGHMADSTFHFAATGNNWDTGPGWVRSGDFEGTWDLQTETGEIHLRAFDGTGPEPMVTAPLEMTPCEGITVTGINLSGPKPPKKLCTLWDRGSGGTPGLMVIKRTGKKIRLANGRLTLYRVHALLAGLGIGSAFVNGDDLVLSLTSINPISRMELAGTLDMTTGTGTGRSFDRDSLEMFEFAVSQGPCSSIPGSFETAAVAVPKRICLQPDPNTRVAIVAKPAGGSIRTADGRLRLYAVSGETYDPTLSFPLVGTALGLPTEWAFGATGSTSHTGTFRNVDVFGGQDVGTGGLIGVAWEEGGARTETVPTEVPCTDLEIDR